MLQATSTGFCGTDPCSYVGNLALALTACVLLQAAHMPRWGGCAGCRMQGRTSIWAAGLTGAGQVIGGGDSGLGACQLCECINCAHFCSHQLLSVAICRSIRGAQG